MKIGIDVSQMAFENAGVSNYLKNLLFELIKNDSENNYVLFFSSLRGKLNQSFINELKSSRVTVKKFWLPPSLLDLLWNRLHIFPIERFVGDIDVFITSDWTEPPSKKALKATILYDLIVYKYPEETDKKIVETQKRKLKWVQKESDVVFCISESTKKDAIEILDIQDRKLKVIHGGIDSFTRN